MNLPLDITFRGLTPSPAVELRVRELLTRLERSCDHISSCALVIERRNSWDSALLFRGDNAAFLWGADYYQNMMLWCLPAALADQDLTGPCQQGGLVERVIRAGNP